MVNDGQRDAAFKEPPRPTPASARACRRQGGPRGGIRSTAPQPAHPRPRTNGGHTRQSPSPPPPAPTAAAHRISAARGQAAPLSLCPPPMGYCVGQWPRHGRTRRAAVAATHTALPVALTRRARRDRWRKAPLGRRVCCPRPRPCCPFSLRPTTAAGVGGSTRPPLHGRPPAIGARPRRAHRQRGGRGRVCAAPPRPGGRGATVASDDPRRGRPLSHPPRRSDRPPGWGGRVRAAACADTLPRGTLPNPPWPPLLGTPTSAADHRPVPPTAPPCGRLPRPRWRAAAAPAPRVSAVAHSPTTVGGCRPPRRERAGGANTAGRAGLRRSALVRGHIPTAAGGRPAAVLRPRAERGGRVRAATEGERGGGWAGGHGLRAQRCWDRPPQSRSLSRRPDGGVTVASIFLTVWGRRRPRSATRPIRLSARDARGGHHRR